jgi:monoamine oxidase
MFRALTRALKQAGAGTGPRALSRRSFLAMTAALAACQGRTGGGDIAIVGAGAAGLTAALRLSAAGRNVALYEASDRVGGRMFTRRDFNEDGQFCELGGELVDTNHTALRNLAQELGVAIQPIAPENGEELYHIDSRLYAQRDMVAPGGASGAFVRLAQRIGEDQAALLDADENWTARARELDAISIRDYLARLNNLAPAWTMKVLDIAYLGEFGIPTAEQSALNLIDFIGTETADGFHIFGESDESARIAGGSSTLTDAIAARLGGNVRRAMQHALAGVARDESGVTLRFDAPEGRIERRHDKVIFALPFTKLRQVEGVDQLGLSDEKLRAIRELGYGDNAKLMMSTRARPWLGAQLPAPSAGVFYSDAFQLMWETSRGQTGERGILTNFLASQQDRDAALAAARAGLRFLPGAADSLDPAKTAWMAWARQPFNLGSYASAKVGQYTTLLEETATPSEDGRIHFAGEHTSVDFLGFMNGAVESGERVAAALLEA